MRSGRRGALILLEECVHLLRRAPWSVHALHALGTLPFLCGFLYFWTGMRSSAFAWQDLPGASAALALAFVWKECWQAVYCGRLRAILQGEQPAAWTAPRVWRLIMQHGGVAPTKLIVLPLALGVFVPWAGAVACYHAYASLAQGQEARLRDLLRAARATGSAQDGWLTGLACSLLTVTVWLNLAIVLLQLPSLVQSLSGVDSNLNRAGFAAANSTLLWIATGLTYLFVDPFARALSILRSFYATGLRTGEDLRAGLRRSLARVALAALLLLPVTLPAQQPPQRAIGVSQLDRAIEQAAQDRRYTWRQPRQLPPEEDTWITSFAKDSINALNRAAAAVGRAIRDFLHWLTDRLRPQPGNLPRAGVPGLTEGARWVLIVLSLLIGGLIVLLWLRRAGTEPAAAAATAALPTVDLEDEQTVATQLPADGWLRLAQQMAQQGDYRAALRAMYLATLAHLGERQLLTILPAKSNRDYQRELTRRARQTPELLDAFTASMRDFEVCWYGRLTASAESVEALRTRLERMRTLAV